MPLMVQTVVSLKSMGCYAIALHLSDVPSLRVWLSNKDWLEKVWTDTLTKVS